MSDNDQTQARLLAGFQAHAEEAKAVPQSAWKALRLSVGEYVQETRGIVDFAESVWGAGPDGAPGLKVAHLKFKRERLDRLRALLDGFQYAYALEVQTAHPVADIGPKSARAQALIAELDAALSFLLDDDIEEPADAQLAALQATTKEERKRAPTLGQLLLAWALFAQAERDRLSALEDFDPALITEAVSLANALTSAQPTATPAERAALRAQRQGFCALAYAEVQALRKAAAYAYRNHPKVKQRFFSALERKRRTSQRAQRKLDDKLAEVTAAPDAAPANPG